MAVVSDPLRLPANCHRTVKQGDVTRHTGAGSTEDTSINFERRTRPRKQVHSSEVTSGIGNDVLHVPAGCQLGQGSDVTRPRECQGVTTSFAKTTSDDRRFLYCNNTPKSGREVPYCQFVLSFIREMSVPQRTPRTTEQA